MSEQNRIYSYATKAWQPLVGCANNLPCWSGCWAHKSVRRIVECQQKNHPDRAAFFQQFVTKKGWSGKVTLDEKHLLDPLSWRKPQIVATGYHGDWALLPLMDIARILDVMEGGDNHVYLTLTKRPEMLTEKLDLLWEQRKLGPGHKPPEHIYIGASIMTQTDTDRTLPHLMRLATTGWQTWVSIEPMVGPINLKLDAGLPSIRWAVLGSESGPNARPLSDAWVRSIRDQCTEAGIPFYYKQKVAGGAKIETPEIDGLRWAQTPWGGE